MKEKDRRRRKSNDSGSLKPCCDSNGFLSYKQKDAISIDDVVTNPIACGYFLAFCEDRFCSESINFWIRVDQYKEKCKTLDFSDDKDLRVAGALATRIWKEFMYTKSKTEVMIPSIDRSETIERMTDLPKHRDRVFDRALNEPFRTLREEILPRFLKSPQYEEYIQREIQMENRDGSNLLREEDFVEKSCPSTTILDFDFPDSKTDFTLTEILCDKYLYKEMLQYLVTRFCPENLLCVREIQIYEEQFQKKEDPSEKAWYIYLTFISKGAEKEISVSTIDKKTIMLSLGRPKKDLFSAAKINAMAMLKQDYKGFRSSREYEELIGFMREKKREMEKVNKKSYFRLHR